MAFSEPLKLALNYAEESSKRSRWIVFILQLGVVLVLSSIWLENDSNWLQLRMNAAQSAVKLLTCMPDQAYTLNPDYREQDIARIKGKIAELSKASVTQINREELDDRYACAALTENEIKHAQEYLQQWNFSLTEAKKNVADLQQLMNTRVIGVTVPILGMVFDINDLSVMSGLTFAILLSWFHFALRRQHDNVGKVFELAESTLGPSATDAERKESLRLTYDLLAMTQVLTIPPDKSSDTQGISFIRRLSRLPSLIMWTAVLAQLIVLWDDISTMKHGDALGVMVSHTETAIASGLFAFILYRTVQCFRLSSKTYDEWLKAYERSYQTNPTRLGARFNKLRIGWILLFLALVVHVSGEFPHVFNHVTHIIRMPLQPILRVALWLADYRDWLTIFIVLPLIFLLFWHIFVKPLNKIYKISWIFFIVLSLDICCHLLVAAHTDLQSEHLQHTMVGFYSLPALILASFNILMLLCDNAKKPERLIKS